MTHPSTQSSIPPTLILGSRARGPLHRGARGLTLTVASLVGAVGVARADAPAPTCAVEVARAPDEVRATIEAWVAEEPTCARSLMVRVDVESDGLHIVAVDDLHRVFERTVPDAVSVGVLVASWAASPGSLPSEPPEPPAAAVLAAPGTAATLGELSAIAAAPGATGDGESVGGGASVDDGGDDMVEGGAVQPAPDPWGRWRVAATTMLDESGRYHVGARGATTLLQRGRWSVEVGAGVDFQPRQDEISSLRAEALASGAWTWRRDAWRARIGLALGVGQGRESYPDMTSTSTHYAVEAGLELGRQLTGRWGGFVALDVRTWRDGLGTAIHDATNFDDDSARQRIWTAGIATAL